MYPGRFAGRFQKNPTRGFRINQGISAPEVRLISENGEQLGVVPTNEARTKAQELEVDLVEIAANATPPVAKLIDFKKHLYQEERREREAKRKAHRVEMKELWLGPLIGEHDLMTRVNRGKEFLGSGDHVKFTIRYSGREMAHKEIGYKVVARVKELLADVAEMEKDPVFFGRQLSMQFRPKK
jgi:translation initiation factor IF-3